VRLETVPTVLTRPGMINIFISEKINRGSAGFTWEGQKLSLYKKPLVIVKASDAGLS